jgi:hypothetical protein
MLGFTTLSEAPVTALGSSAATAVPGSTTVTFSNPTTIDFDAEANFVSPSIAALFTTNTLGFDAESNITLPNTVSALFSTQDVTVTADANKVSPTVQATFSHPTTIDFDAEANFVSPTVAMTFSTPANAGFDAEANTNSLPTVEATILFDATNVLYKGEANRTLDATPATFTTPTTLTSKGTANIIIQTAGMVFTTQDVGFDAEANTNALTGIQNTFTVPSIIDGKASANTNPLPTVGLVLTQNAAWVFDIEDVDFSIYTTNYNRERTIYLTTYVDNRTVYIEQDYRTIIVSDYRKDRLVFIAA